MLVQIRIKLEGLLTKMGLVETKVLYREMLMELAQKTWPFMELVVEQNNSPHKKLSKKDKDDWNLIVILNKDLYYLMVKSIMSKVILNN